MGAGLIHEAAVNNVLLRDNKLKIKGFAKAVREIVSEEFLDDDVFKDSINIVPDAFKIIDGGHYDNCFTVVICEVEDHSKISSIKMQKIINLWNFLDAESHILELKVFDRFGNFVNTLEMIEYYHQSIIQG